MTVAFLWASLAAAMSLFQWDVDDEAHTPAPTVLVSPVHNEDLKILWWNIREGNNLGRDHPGTNPLEQNLKRLVSLPSAPEVLLFGEYKTGAFAPDTEALLSRAYPHQSVFSYNALRSEMMIKVYSRYPFLKSKSFLDWTKYPASAEAQASYATKWQNQFDPELQKFYGRVFVDIRIRKGTEIWDLVPVHLLNNWVRLKDQLGKVEAGLILNYGTDNPHYYQMKRLRKEKLAPLLAEVEKDSHRHLVVVGDFNLPATDYKIMPVSFAAMKDLLNEVPIRDFTFPAISVGVQDIPRFCIDHAFHDDHTDVVTSARLLFKGSDHYPLEIQFKASP